MSVTERTVPLTPAELFDLHRSIVRDVARHYAQGPRGTLCYHAMIECGEFALAKTCADWWDTPGWHFRSLAVGAVREAVLTWIAETGWGRWAGLRVNIGSGV